MRKNFEKLNFVPECRLAGLSLWQCPPFLLIVLGVITITSMIAASLLTSRYFEEPEIPTIFIVSFLSIFFLVVGNSIIHGFHKIAEANRLKSEFISIISHQLRTPLAVFKWTLDILDKEADKGTMTPDSLNFMRTLRETADSMILLVNTLLEASRIEAGTFVLRKDACDLNALTKNAIKSFELFAGASNISISYEPPPAVSNTLADKERIEMVMQMLLDNAIRYTPKSGTIRIALTRDDHRYRWTIEDQGVGIPQEQQKMMFQKFFRADNAKKLQADGSGIDLYIAKAVIETSGGRLGFTSEEGKGTTFWFTLPAQ